MGDNERAMQKPKEKSPMKNYNTELGKGTVDEYVERLAAVLMRA